MSTKTNCDIAARTVALCAGLCIPAICAGAAITYSTVARTGTDGAFGPGQGAGVTFSTVDSQAFINDNGQVSFRANNSTDALQGIWRFSAGSNSNVVTAGAPMPGGGTFTSGTTGIFANHRINANGDVAFRMGASSGVFATSAGVLHRGAIGGDTAPDTGGATFAATSTVTTSAPLYNNAGQIGFIASLTSGTGSPAVVTTGATANNTGLWIGTPSSLSLAVRRNDNVTALDPSGNVRVNTLDNLSVAMNASGRFATSATLQGTVTTGTGAGSNANAILTNRSGSLDALARTGDAAPDYTGAPSATELYRGFATGAIGFNNNGKVFYNATVRDAAGTNLGSALFTDSNGTLRRIAKSGDSLPTISNAAPGEFAGAAWTTLYSNMVMNSNNTVAFSAGLTGGTSTGAIFTMDPAGVFSKIVKQGDIAIVDGAPLGGDALFNTFQSGLSFNSINQMIFSVTLSGNGVFGGPGGNNSALFAYDPIQGLNLIARTGDAFEFAPGDFRTISSIGGGTTSGGEDGRQASLNNNGVAVFGLSFSEGGSGVYTVTIPSPGALGLLSLGALATASRKRR